MGFLAHFEINLDFKGNSLDGFENGVDLKVQI